MNYLLEPCQRTACAQDIFNQVTRGHVQPCLSVYEANCGVLHGYAKEQVPLPAAFQGIALQPQQVDKHCTCVYSITHLPLLRNARPRERDLRPHALNSDEDDVGGRPSRRSSRSSMHILKAGCWTSPAIVSTQKNRSATFIHQTTH